MPYAEVATIAEKKKRKRERQQARPADAVPRKSGGLSRGEEEVVEQHLRLRAAVVYEIIRVEGEGELARGAPALWWSGLAAGLSIGFSVLGQAFLAAHLPETSWKPLIENLGYSIGFLIVIMGRQQLFTENTLTAVLPVIVRRRMKWLYVMLRLWGIVLAANLVGCFLFAATIYYSDMLTPDVRQAVTEIGLRMMENTAWEMFLKGIGAGWLIAALVWILPSSEGTEFLVIGLFAYLVALGGFTHVIAGAAENFYLMLEGTASPDAVLFRFLLPTLAGNMVGGTVLFAVLSYAQVRDEI